MEEEIFNLLKYVLIISTIISVTIDGLKRHAKSATKVEKINPVITIILSYVFGILSAFLIKSPFISLIWQKVIMGIIIGSWSSVLYSSSIKSITNIIPTLFSKISK